ncbi:hypothetical protein BGZ72_003232, partial [Mortierella alpina]
DVDRSSVLPTGELELLVVGPKEKRGGQHIVKSIFIHPHEDPLICPVATYQAYVALTATSSLSRVKHPYLDQYFRPLVRHAFNINKAATTDTISRHIRTMSALINLPPGLDKTPSGRSIGSSLSIEHGASSDE